MGILRVPETTIRADQIMSWQDEILMREPVDSSTGLLTESEMEKYYKQRAKDLQKACAAHRAQERALADQVHEKNMVLATIAGKCMALIDYGHPVSIADMQEILDLAGEYAKGAKIEMITP